MKIVVKETEQEASSYVAEIIGTALREKPELSLSLPTGSTPVHVLEDLVRKHHEEGLSFAKASLFNMDEYLGLGRNHPQGYYHFLDELLYSQVDVDRARTFAPDALDPVPEHAAAAYTKLIQDAGGFDLIFLGIGRDGHICFNMPADSLHPYTHLERLSEKTMADNARFFDDASEVPTHAITIGLKLVLDSRKIILLATGSGKNDIVRELLASESITTQLPASFLRLHDDVTIVLDAAAAVGIELA